MLIIIIINTIIIIIITTIIIIITTINIIVLYTSRNKTMSAEIRTINNYLPIF